MAIEFEITQRFEQPPHRVFEGLTDLDRADEWMPAFVSIDRLTPGPFAVGTEWRETRKFFGKEATEQFEVTRHDPPTQLGVRVDGSKGSSKKGEYLFDYQLEAEDGGTTVTLHGKIQGLSGFSALFGKLMAGPYKKACANDLRALAEHLGRAG